MSPRTAFASIVACMLLGLVQTCAAQEYSNLQGISSYGGGYYPDYPTYDYQRYPNNWADSYPAYSYGAQPTFYGRQGKDATPPASCSSSMTVPKRPNAGRSNEVSSQSTMQSQAGEAKAASGSAYSSRTFTEPATSVPSPQYPETTPVRNLEPQHPVDVLPENLGSATIQQLLSNPANQKAIRQLFAGQYSRLNPSAPGYFELPYDPRDVKALGANYNMGGYPVRQPYSLPTAYQQQQQQQAFAPLPYSPAFETRYYPAQQGNKLINPSTVAKSSEGSQTNVNQHVNQPLPPNLYKTEKWEPSTNLLIEEPMNLREYEQPAVQRQMPYAWSSYRQSSPTNCRQKRQLGNEPWPQMHHSFSDFGYPSEHGISDFYQNQPYLRPLQRTAQAPWESLADNINHLINPAYMSQYQQLFPVAPNYAGTQFRAADQDSVPEELSQVVSGLAHLFPVLGRR